MNNRQPKGIPTGGQFAANSHAEPCLDLTPLDVDREAADHLPEWTHEYRTEGLTWEDHHAR